MNDNVNPTTGAPASAAPITKKLDFDDVMDEITTELVKKISRLSRKHGHNETEVGLSVTVSALLQLIWRVPYPQWRGELAEEAIQRLQLLQVRMPSLNPEFVENTSAAIN